MTRAAKRALWELALWSVLWLLYTLTDGPPVALYLLALKVGMCIPPVDKEASRWLRARAKQRRAAQ